jgi:5-methylcytosine-specific restriction protein A
MTVIKKICQVIDGEYVCDIDISVEEWKILLMNEKVFDSKSIAALKNGSLNQVILARVSI